MVKLEVLTATRGSGVLHTSAIYTHLSPDKRACIVDLRVSNPGHADVLINSVEFEVLEFLRKIPMGEMKYSATYDIDISDTISYMSTAECQVAQILKPGEADRFAVVLSATSLAATCAAWKFAVRLKTNCGVYNGPNTDVVFSADEPSIKFDALKMLIREKAIKQLATYSQRTDLTAENRNIILNTRPGPFGGFITFIGGLLCEYSGPLPIINWD
ncbi:hypothetical protein [Paraburkholderia phenazinium]|uniref:hypothetical protein n=1 Tax=Paraburkholderia phenazinium TaxID=60549 RepID=UPI00158E152F|nr:hypothetical protein [Paraburkholderia phenazinium]